MGSVLYLMRHARAAEPGVLTGALDSALTPEGRAQALAWRPFFDANPVHAVWSSPLRRARETAALCLGGAEVEVEIVEGLREISLGLWEGMTKEAVRAQWPREWEARGEDPFNAAPPGGESFQVLDARVWPVFSAIARRAALMPASLLVAHQAVNRCILARLSGLKADSLFAIPQAEACLNILRLEGDFCSVEALDMTLDKLSGRTGALPRES